MSGSCELAGQPIFVDGRVPCHACGVAVKAVLVDGLWVYAPHGHTDEDVAEEGEQDRLFYGIDGTMGDAQDVPHPNVTSIYGGWCSLCGLGSNARPHRRWLEKQAPSAGSEGDR